MAVRELRKHRGKPQFGRRVRQFAAFDSLRWRFGEDAWELGQFNGCYLLSGLAPDQRLCLRVGETERATLVFRVKNSPPRPPHFPALFDAFVFPNFDSAEKPELIARERLLMEFVEFALPGSLRSRKGNIHWGRAHRRQAARWLGEIAPGLTSISPAFSQDMLRSFAETSPTPEADALWETMIEAQKVATSDRTL